MKLEFARDRVSWSIYSNLDYRAARKPARTGQWLLMTPGGNRWRLYVFIPDEAGQALHQIYQ